MTGNPYRYYRLCAWLGLIMIPLTVIFWGILGQNIPPYSAALSADEFAVKIIENADSIRIGMIGQVLISFMYLPWGLAIAKVMEHVEEDNNILSTIELWSAGLTVLVFMIPCSLWLAVVFRPEAMDPQILQMVFDYGWIFFDTTFSMTSMGMIAMGVCFLSDKREVPLIPAWVCWLAIAVAISFLIVLLMPLFKTGVFSRSGTINYWIEFGVFFIYWTCTAVYIIKAIPRLEQEYQLTQA